VGSRIDRDIFGRVRSPPPRIARRCGVEVHAMRADRASEGPAIGENVLLRVDDDHVVRRLDREVNAIADG